MTAFITLVIGAVVGFFAHALTMKVNFKQRAIDNKIKVYDGLIGKWVQMRNHIYANWPPPEQQPDSASVRQFDQMYGESQTLIGEVILVCEDDQLTADINDFNERFYRTRWYGFTFDQANEQMETFKRDGMAIIVRMRGDVKADTRLEWTDLVHMFTGFRRKGR